MSTRRIEWLSALAMCGWSVSLAMPGDSIAERAAYAPLIKMGWTETNVALLMGVIGLTWCAALIINGSWRRSPILRMFGALGGAFVWGQIAVLLTQESIRTGTSSPAVFMYALLCVFDLFACASSARDAVLAHRGEAYE